LRGRLSKEGDLGSYWEIEWLKDQMNSANTKNRNFLFNLEICFENKLYKPTKIRYLVNSANFLIEANPVKDIVKVKLNNTKKIYNYEKYDLRKFVNVLKNDFDLKKELSEKIERDKTVIFTKILKSRIESHERVLERDLSL